MSLTKHEVNGAAQMCCCCGSGTDQVHYRYSYPAGEAFIYRCGACGFEFMRPLALADVAERRMESIDDAEMFHSPLLKTLHERLIIRPEINRVKELLGRSNFRMLDVGCGTGWISRIWADAGVNVTGLEPSEARAARSRERGIRVLSCFAEELDTKERFDLIVARHVIEHLEEPEKILISLSRLLSPEGIILLVVPNIDCIGRKVFNADWTWVLPWHCNFFNPRSLETLLKTCNYEIVRLCQTASPLWYPESFRRRYPMLGRFIGLGPFGMALFSPLVLMGYFGGYSDNITVFAKPKSCKDG